MSVRDYRKSNELESIQYLIEDIRKIQKRLIIVEQELLDLEQDKQREII